MSCFMLALFILLVFLFFLTTDGSLSDYRAVEAGGVCLWGLNGLVVVGLCEGKSEVGRHIKPQHFI